MPRTIGLLGVPSSAGAHWPGQEKAPAALRELGLIERLEDASLHVSDHGDLPPCVSSLISANATNRTWPP